MHRLYYLIIATTALIVLMIGALLVASQAMTSPHLQSLTDTFGPDRCGQFCWHNIHLGKTTFIEAENILRSDPTVTWLDSGDPGCQINWQTTVETVIWKGRICAGKNGKLTEPVTTLDLFAADEFADTQFNLMDTIEIFGNPTGAQCSSAILMHQASTYAASLNFQGGVQVSSLHLLPYTGPVFDPRMEVSQIRYLSEVNQHYIYSGPWHGFISERFDINAHPSPCSNAIE